MVLTQTHDENRLLTPDQIEETLDNSSFLNLFDLNTFERAEVFDRLNTEGARVKMRTKDEDIKVLIERARGEPEIHIIPGKGKPSKPFPIKVAIYVAANRDYPQFGGPSWKVEKAIDGYSTVVPVPARPDLIEFELIKE